MKKLLVGAVIGAFILISSPSRAEIPHMVNYQGMLTSDAGDPLNGSYDLNFKIYGSESGNDSLWWEYHSGVTVTDGLFNVILGGTNPIQASLFDDTVRYFGITVDTDPELSPRIRLTSMPYAYRALVADSAAVVGSGTGGAGGWVDDGSVVRLETTTDKVGIGTTSPGAKLQVGDGSSDDFIRVMGSTAAASAEMGAHMDGFGYLKIYDDGGTAIALLDPEDGKSYIKYGSLGIGTVSPQDKVEVVDGSVNARLCHISHISFPLPYDAYSGVKGAYGDNVNGFLGYRYYSSIGGNAYYGVYGSATTTGKNFGVYGYASGGSPNWAGFFSGDVHVSGNVGIGTTTPDDDLHVANHIRVGEDPTYSHVYGELIHDGGGTGFKINANASGGWADMHLQTDGTTRIFIESAGKVGIGTTSPSERLDVAGGNIDVSNGQIKNYYGFPKPDYDSGWRGITQNGDITLTHNLYGNIDNYVVELCFKDYETGPNNQYYGGMETGDGDHYYGACWRYLTTTQINVYRWQNDYMADYVRVRIWVIR